MIEICNLRNERMQFAYDVRVDRAEVIREFLNKYIGG